jgi:hypothetical protein
VSAPALEALLAGRAALLEGAAVAALPGGGVELRLDGRPFALVEGGRAAFRLRPEVAAAALRTPDVSPVEQGDGWVWFAPPALDELARDRALAWLDHGWRRANEESTGESNAPPGPGGADGA